MRPLQPVLERYHQDRPQGLTIRTRDGVATQESSHIQARRSTLLRFSPVFTVFFGAARTTRRGDDVGTPTPTTHEVFTWTATACRAGGRP
eukprot:568097-Prymnesium_polylepis.1